MYTVSTSGTFFDKLWAARFLLLDGLKNTLVVSILAILIGTFIGILIALVTTYGNKYARWPFKVLINIIRGMPGLVTIFIIYYFLDFLLQSWGIYLSQMAVGVIALTAPCSAQVAELIRGALSNIPKGQIDAGRAIGMNFPKILVHILLPQAAVAALPPWVNTATEIVKGSSLLSLVSITELLLVTKQLVARDPRALAYYTFIGFVYFTINTLIEAGGRAAEKQITLSKNM